MATAARRRIRIRKTAVLCPHCGEEIWVQVAPQTFVRCRKDPPATPVLTVSCARHCGGDVPITAGDVQAAA